jgi:transposase
LTKLVSSGRHPARAITRARVLLALDESHEPAPDRRVVAERVGTSQSTVYLVAKAFTTHAGRVEDVIGRKKRTTPPIEPKVTGDVEARLIALACSQPPPGRARWTLRLLERQVALTEGIPPMDHSTIGRVLKRGRLNLT